VFNTALSPVVVKDMRQGLKSRGFVLGLAGLQLLMVFSMLMYLNADTRHRHEVANSFFWLCLALPLLAIIPLRGFYSVQEERNNKTLELLLLTRLSAWQIAKGKWQALFCQSLLMFVSVLPYLLLRYFLGSVELIMDIIVLGYLLLLSGQFTAFGVFIGSMQTRIGRVTGLIVGPGVYLLALSVLGFIFLFGGRGWGVHLSMLILGIIATALHLDNTAHLIDSSKLKPRSIPPGLPYGDKFNA